MTRCSPKHNVANCMVFNSSSVLVFKSVNSVNEDKRPETKEELPKGEEVSLKR